MYAVEFETKINNGVVEIPLEYNTIRMTDKNVKVIIMTDIQNEDHIESKENPLFDNFLSLSKEVASFDKFDRDALHER